MWKPELKFLDGDADGVDSIGDIRVELGFSIERIDGGTEWTKCEASETQIGVSESMEN